LSLAKNLPFHMHVSEQRSENTSCLEEHGLRPVELLDELGCLGPAFVAVHATHLVGREAQLLGEARSFVCFCRTTERDLGDGLVDARMLLDAGVRPCTGVDSHAVSDPFEEARAIELDDRSRSESRQSAAEAPTLLRALCGEGYASIGMAGLEGEDRVLLDARDPALADVSSPLIEDHVIFAASPRSVHSVEILGERIVEDSTHRNEGEIRGGYRKALRRLGLL
ncbi:MAG: amidohydrolase family protein, partial [Myxococcales bacterium]|nr:amidohydrolase family protein [Myxococcales bacterium]